MAAGSGTVTVRILGDAKDLKGALDESDTALGKFSDKMKSTGQSIAGIGAKMSAAVTLPLVAIGKVAFDAASDLNESMSKVGVVFGENAKDIEDWSQDAAKSLGMSRQAALEATGTFGNFLQSMGLARGPAADMSKSLVTLAADLASFNNADPEEVLLALRSGLSGEAEPMRKFGVALSETAVKAKAAELGLGDLHGELSEGEKIQARYAIVMDQTAMAQGDFARTADGAANKQRILKAQFQDAAAVLGNKLIPIGQKLITWAASLVTGFTKLSDQTQNIILVVAGLAAASGPLVTVIGALVTAIGALLTPIGAAILLLAVIAGSFVYAYTQIEGFREAVDTVVAVAVTFAKIIREQLDPVIKFLSEHTSELKAILTVLAVVIGGAVLVSITSFAVGVGIAVAALVAIARVVTLVIQAMQWFWEKTEGLRAFLADAFRKGMDVLKTAFDQVRGAVDWLWSSLDRVIGVLETAIDLANQLNPLHSNIGDMADEMLRQAGFQANARNIRGGMGFASGGLVPGPIGRPMLATVHGGEFVSTAAEVRAGLNGGGTLIVNFNGPVAKDAESWVISMIEQATRKGMRLGVSTRKAFAAP